MSLAFEPQFPIEESHYRDASCREMYEQMTSSSTVLDSLHVANFLIKYFLTYNVPDLVDKKISFGQAQSYFCGIQTMVQKIRQLDYLMRHGKTPEIRQHATEEKKKYCDGLEMGGNKDFEKLAYALAMLGDIPSTVAIFRDIGNRNLQKMEQGLLVDQGCGTGVTLIAASICAQRNGMQDSQLYGIELSPEVQKMTKGVIDRLLGKAKVQIVHGDTKTPEAYRSLPDGSILMVSNENLPLENEPMISEPWFPNNAQMRNILKSRGQKFGSVECFPRQVAFQAENGATIELNQSDYFQGGGELDKMEATMWRAGESFEKNTRPKYIDIHGKMVPLSRVGVLGSMEGIIKNTHPLLRRW